MSTEDTKPSHPADMLQRILLDFLQASTVHNWPGADGLQVEDILNCYPQASAAGEVPDCQELCRRHRELTTEIQSLFLLKDWLRNRDPQGSAPKSPNESSR